MALPQEVRSVYQSLVGGTGLVRTKYPVDAAGVALTASGMTTGAYKFAAAGANVAAIVAKATIASNWRLVGVCLNTFSAASIFVIRLGRGAAGGAAVTQVLAEVIVNEITAAGVVPHMGLGFTATVVADGATDAILGDAASSNAAADDTVVASVEVATGLGT